GPGKVGAADGQLDAAGLAGWAGRDRQPTVPLLRVARGLPATDVRGVHWHSSVVRSTPGNGPAPWRQGRAPGNEVLPQLRPARPPFVDGLLHGPADPCGICSLRSGDSGHGLGI